MGQRPSLILEAPVCCEESSVYGHKSIGSFCKEKRNRNTHTHIQGNANEYKREVTYYVMDNRNAD